MEELQALQAQFDEREKGVIEKLVVEGEVKEKLKKALGEVRRARNRDIQNFMLSVMVSLKEESIKRKKERVRRIIHENEVEKWRMNESRKRIRANGDYRHHWGHLSLPLEMWQHVFSFMDKKQLLWTVGLVCSDWR